MIQKKKIKSSVSKKIKVAVGMSGGVDSSVAAALLKLKGYEVIGIFMQFWNDHDLEAGDNKCCSLQAFNDAKKVAQLLKIPIYTMNFKQPFKKFIVDNFIEQYRQGKTPNPCVRCNQLIKFGEFYKKAKALGCEYIATGHYVRLSQDVPIKIFKGLDNNKDQSYFLYRLSHDVLQHCIFPIGDYQKSEVRKLAERLKLPVFNKKDSQEVCFVPTHGLESFFKKYLKLKPGKIVDLQGNVLGQHKGLPLYTIGQRRGMDLGGNGPYFVVKLDIANNNLVVSNHPADLLKDEMIIGDVNFINKVRLPAPLTVKIRYGHAGAKAVVSKYKSYYKVKFAEKQRAITPGQSAVFYRGNELIGGGIIL
jgi:tRNA-specific 2-thiouridylase